MSRFGRLIAEIHRRYLWQVLGIYVVGGWIAYQVVWTFTESLGLPDWIPQFALILLIVLLPVVLATAFVQEGVGRGEDRAEPTATPDLEAAEAGPRRETPETEVRRGAWRVLTWRNAILAGQEQVANVLRRMGREPGAPLDYQLAREVAIRQGLKAVTAGEVIEVGGGYVVAARLVVAETGEELWTDSETARDSTEIFDSIDRLSRRLRERIGESLRTIRSSRPLAQVTTSSLDALRKYSQASRALGVEGDFNKGIGLLREAIALDTAFAMAYLSLGWVAYIYENQTATVEALTEAYRYRDRLTDRERYYTIGSYYAAVTGEHEKAITAFRTLVDAYPDSSFGLGLLGASYTMTRQHARAVEAYRRKIELDSTDALAYRVLFSNQMSLGDFQEAQATLDRMIENHNPYAWGASAWLAFSREDYEGAEAALRADEGSRAAVSDLAGLARLRGKLDEAERLFGEVMARRQAEWRYLRDAVRLALLHFQLGDGLERGIQTAEDALERHPLATIPVLDRPYAELAEFYASAGRPDQARALLAEHDAAVEPPLGWRTEWRRHLAEGYVALAEGRYSDAIAEFRLADDRSMNHCRSCALPPLADAYDLAGEADSAVAIYERFLGGEYFAGTELHAALRYLPSIYERLGALYEQRGDAAKAIHYYGKLVELWKDADPELQSRVEAARRAMEALSPDT